MNVVVVAGRLSRLPEERILPSGDRVVGFEVTVPAAEASGGRAESVPVAWPEAPDWALRLDAGAEVVVLGRVRRRFFRAGQRTESRTEVVADRVVPRTSARRVATLLERARQTLEPDAGRKVRRR